MSWVRGDETPAFYHSFSNPPHPASANFTLFSKPQHPSPAQGRRADLCKGLPGGEVRRVLKERNNPDTLNTRAAPNLTVYLYGSAQSAHHAFQTLRRPIQAGSDYRSELVVHALLLKGRLPDSNMARY